ncbi:hypothetical protein LCGC14_0530340 [marine sediment metagenome]|uniref:Spore protein YkvP/CgeB glycosyl transferase-like domain-containing protein n=1 Tax=marine sediment metagenome TaxID=412755 RepID=A0A0F9S0I3_9ZZZZ
MDRKLKILRLSYTPPNARYSNDQSVFDELHKQADVIFVDIVKLKDPALIDKKIAALIKKHDFDFIYKNFVGPSVDSLKMRPLYEYGIPTVVSSGDCHTRLTNSIYNDRANHHKFDVILVNNGSTISCFKDYFDRDMNYIWIPWSYNTAIHRNYGESVKYDTCIPASNFKINIRKKINKYLSASKYNHIMIKGLSPMGFSKRINQCKIGVSTCQIEHRWFYKKTFVGMTFTKYYEIPMCNALHIGQKSGDAENLGFIDGENIVMFETFEEFKDKCDFYLNNEKGRLRILKNARKHVEPMTYENRMKEFLVRAKKLI